MNLSNQDQNLAVVGNDFLYWSQDRHKKDSDSIEFYNLSVIFEGQKASFQKTKIEKLNSFGYVTSCKSKFGLGVQGGTGEVQHGTG